MLLGYIGGQGGIAPFAPSGDNPFGSYLTGAGGAVHGGGAQYPNTVPGNLQKNGGLQGYPDLGTDIPGINNVTNQGGSQGQPLAGGGPTSGVAQNIPMGAGAGTLPGTIFPDYQDILNTAGQSFFGNLAGDNPNPIFSDAVGNLYNSGGSGGSSLNYSSGGANVNIPTNDFADRDFLQGVPMQFGDRLVSQGQIQGATNTLANPDSLFDTISGGPIVDEMNRVTNEQLDRVGARLAENRDEAIERQMANLAGNGLLSSNQAIQSGEEITRDSLNDYTLAALDFERDNINLLSQLAQQDAQLQTNSAAQLLSTALQEKGIDADFANSIAQAKSNELIAQEQMKNAARIAEAELANQRALQALQNQNQLAIANQQAAVDVLGLGLQDFGNTQGNLLGAQQLPLNIAQGVMSGVPGISTGSSSSKSI